MPNIGPVELLVIAILALVVLGPRKLPEAGRSLGRGMREFRDAITGGHEPEAAEAARTRPPASPIPPPA